MALRESARRQGFRVNLEAVLPGRDGSPAGVAGEAVLQRFGRALVAGSEDERAQAHAAVAGELGPAALVDTAAVAAFFNAIDRVADATGTVPDALLVQATAAYLPGIDVAEAIAVRPGR